MFTYKYSTAVTRVERGYIVSVQIVDGNQEQQIFPSYIPVIVKRYNGCHRVDFCQGSRRNNIYYYPRSLDLGLTPRPKTLFRTNVNTTRASSLSTPLPIPSTHTHALRPRAPPPLPTRVHSFRNHQSS